MRHRRVRVRPADPDAAATPPASRRRRRAPAARSCTRRSTPSRPGARSGSSGRARGGSGSSPTTARSSRSAPPSTHSRVVSRSSPPATPRAAPTRPCSTAASSRSARQGRQADHGPPLTEKLSCPKAGNASVAAKKKKRRLWGDGEGKFRTKGKHSAATVVGTKWLVEDRCKSTLTRVVRGRVSVRDFAKKKTVIVRAGKRYIARAG